MVQVVVAAAQYRHGAGHVYSSLSLVAIIPLHHFLPPPLLLIYSHLSWHHPVNYCACSKILKKHDKATGLQTRDAFMRNIMSVANFTHYPYIIELLRESERLFTEIQQMDQ